MSAVVTSEVTSRLGQGKGELQVLFHSLGCLSILKEDSISALLVPLKFILKKVSVGGEHMDAAGVDQTHLSNTTERKEKNPG